MESENLTFWSVASLVLLFVTTLSSLIATVNDALGIVTWQFTISITILIVTLFPAFRFTSIWEKIEQKQWAYAIVTGLLIFVWIPPIYSSAYKVVVPPTFTFDPAEDGEILIVVADFDRAEGVNDARADEKIVDAIKAQSNNDSVKVKLDPTQLRSGDREAAQKLGDQYNATLIVWGEEDTVSMDVNFLNLRTPSFTGSDVSIQNPDNVYYWRLSLDCRYFSAII